jgi:hypothetical protein
MTPTCYGEWSGTPRTGTEYLGRNHRGVEPTSATRLTIGIGPRDVQVQPPTHERVAVSRASEVALDRDEPLPSHLSRRRSFRSDTPTCGHGKYPETTLNNARRRVLHRRLLKREAARAESSTSEGDDGASDEVAGHGVEVVEDQGSDLCRGERIG